MITFKQNKKGYTLLFSVVIASVVLAIAAFIVQVSRKQLFLSSVWRDSTMAIYAADSGIQCVAKVFSSNSTFATAGSPLSCNGEDLIQSGGGTFSSESLGGGKTYAGNLGNEYTYSPAFLSNKTCFIITVKVAPITPGTDYMLRAESRGYNISDGTNCPVNNPRTLERAIKLEYKGPVELFQ